MNRIHQHSCRQSDLGVQYVSGGPGYLLSRYYRPSRCLGYPAGYPWISCRVPWISCRVSSHYTALHPRTAVSLIARSGLAPGGPCHLPAPVGTEVQPPHPGAGPHSAGVRNGQRGPPAGGLRQAPRHPPAPQPRQARPQQVGNTSTQTQDDLPRFLPFKLEQHLVPSLASSWLQEHGPECRLEQCVSDQVVGLHYVQPEQMYVLDFLFSIRQETGKS